MADGQNAAQITCWNADVGDRWTRLQEVTDRMFAPVAAVALDRAAVRPGERAVDIGCGCGETVIGLAERVGPGGQVLGVDVSAVMLARAAARTAALPQVRLIEADAAVHPFAGDADLVFSRFGVMFFDDPPAAFGNIRRALRPGGRLLMAVWRSLRENPWAAIPLQAALPHLPPPPPPDPHAPGPFALADARRLAGILENAGFSRVAIDPVDVAVPLGDAGKLAQAAALALQIGPAALAAREADAAARAAAEAAILAALRPHDHPTGLRLPGGVWIVAAEAA